MTSAELLQYYATLLIVQYRGLPKSEQTIQLLANNAVCDGLPLQLQNCFNLDQAVGAQLDIIGIIVGVPRNIAGLDLEHLFFQFTRYAVSNTTQGFGRYTDTPYSSNLFRRYREDATYVMTDFEMRSVLKLKIIYNNRYETLKIIKEALFVTFPSINGSVGWTDLLVAWDSSGVDWDGGGTVVMSVDIVDTLNMTAEYIFYQPYHNTGIIADFLGILPRPMGVAVTVNYL